MSQIKKQGTKAGLPLAVALVLLTGAGLEPANARDDVSGVSADAFASDKEWLNSQRPRGPMFRRDPGLRRDVSFPKSDPQPLRVTQNASPETTASERPSSSAPEAVRSTGTESTSPAPTPATATEARSESTDQLFPGEPIQLAPDRSNQLSTPDHQGLGLDPASEVESPSDLQRALETPAEPELKLRLFESRWDLAELESPLFGTEEITEFSRQTNAKGKWSLRPHLSITSLYDGNVFIKEDDKEKDFILVISPGVSFHLGNDQTPFYLTAHYTASAVFFLNNGSENTLDHRGGLNLQWAGSKLRLGLILGFAIDSGTNIDATDRVRRTTFYSGITSHYDYSEKISFDLSAEYQPTEYENLIGSHTSRIQGYVNYNATPKLTIGVGGALGFVSVDAGPDQRSEELSLRAIYAATGKLTLTANAGVEFRQFSGGGGDSTNPVFGLDAAWAVREGTSVTLSGRRRIFSSAILEAQNYVDTGVAVSIRQRMTDRFDLYLSAGYDHLEYEATRSGVSATREDDYFFIRPAIQWHALSWCSVGLFYEFSQNSSSGEMSRSFQRDRAGLQVSITY